MTRPDDTGAPDPMRGDVGDGAADWECPQCDGQDFDCPACAAHESSFISATSPDCWRLVSLMSKWREKDDLLDRGSWLGAGIIAGRVARPKKDVQRDLAFLAAAGKIERCEMSNGTFWRGTTEPAALVQPTTAALLEGVTRLDLRPTAYGPALLVSPSGPYILHSDAARIVAAVEARLATAEREYHRVWNERDAGRRRAEKPR